MGECYFWGGGRWLKEKNGGQDQFTFRGTKKAQRAVGAVTAVPVVLLGGEQIGAEKYTSTRGPPGEFQNLGDSCFLFLNFFFFDRWRLPLGSGHSQDVDRILARGLDRQIKVNLPTRP
jgi:hypothetical protein